MPDLGLHQPLWPGVPFPTSPAQPGGLALAFISVCLHGGLVRGFTHSTAIFLAAALWQAPLKQAE